MTIRAWQGHVPDMATGVYVDDSAEVIGDVQIGQDSSVWPRVVIRADVNRIRIGSKTNIQDGSILHVTHASDYAPQGHALELGDRITVGHGVILHGCRIGDECLLGMGSIILDGATLEPGLLLAAGSLVPQGKLLKSGYLWMGRPAVAQRRLEPSERDYLSYSASHYVALKNRYLMGDNKQP